MGKALAGVAMVCFSSYSLVGILGLVAVAQLHASDPNFTVAANILDSFPSQAPCALVMRALMAVAATAVYPMLLLPCRSTLDHLLRVGMGWDLDKSSSPRSVEGETWLIIFVTLFLAHCGSDLARVFGFTGATAGALICYLLPAACYLRLRRSRAEEEQRATWGRATACVCVLACVGPLSAVEVLLQFCG